MDEIYEFNPEIVKSFFALTEKITNEIEFDNKYKELILIGIFTANRGLNGLKTHIKRAVSEGATHSEIYHTILLSLPVVGIIDVNLAFKEAKKILEGETHNGKNN